MEKGFGLLWLFVGLTAVTLLVLMDSTSGCDEAICASLVSKCLLLKSCECNMMDKANCTCCKDCHRCLARLYTECCSCVGMCPEQSSEDSWTKTSSVELLTDPIPDLFNVLTEEEDPYLRWTTYTYPAHLDLLYFQPEGSELQFGLETPVGNTDNHAEEDDTRPHIRHGRHRLIIDSSSSAMNCTVAYMSQCMSINKCKVGCQSMGAARYRWFHEHGCCECIGSTCLDYGKGEALCMHCPPEEEEKEEDYYYYYDSHEEGKYQEEGNSANEDPVDGATQMGAGVEDSVVN